MQLNKQNQNVLQEQQFQSKILHFIVLLYYLVYPTDPLARIVPLLLNATELTQEECPVRVVISVQDSTFHSFIVLSIEDPLARIVPLLLNATEQTESECPVRVVISVQDSTFHSFIVLSSDPLARIVPLY
eukprot:TRINITY_DN4483_c0_g1_i5.p1 TRINITY_DN4483_c0_g1~~TRINITY_DN4483_c0_g1_i5.p1  ORF type:complete len:130 (-),score=1.36 TRINITY_DN4483_c0_g1_i5:162-551(-)